MKVILATLAFLLILAVLYTEANEEPVNKLTPGPCCFAYISRRVPLRFVEGYDRTSDQCPTPGVIFLTRQGRQICANPSVAWVQEYIRHLDHVSK
ncbi:regakine-1-like [Mirounga angustirostris]|uniref:regakine-1-like n=1 Tax=Mirounga angustirostris TaxID=9716 RepID=UPI001E68B412|nr:regakine-1-like [Mirounga angustirostris]